MRHAYPEDLARVLRTQWDNPRGPAARAEMADGHAPARLPDAPILEDFLSICYQVSLLREEARLCSAIIAPPPSGHLHVQPIAVVQTTTDRTGHSGDALAAWAGGLADGVVITMPSASLPAGSRWHTMKVTERR